MKEQRDRDIADSWALLPLDDKTCLMHAAAHWQWGPKCPPFTEWIVQQLDDGPIRLPRDEWPHRTLRAAYMASLGLEAASAAGTERLTQWASLVRLTLAAEAFARLEMRDLANGN